MDTVCSLASFHASLFSLLLSSYLIHPVCIVHCTVLTWLDLSHNQLDSLVGIRNLVNLVVLRASHNSITACGDLSTLTS